MNPWKVDSIQEFAFLNCPECVFKSKEENLFQDHAISNHPDSSVLFNQVTEIILTDDVSSFENIIVTDFTTQEPPPMQLQTIIEDSNVNIVDADNTNLEFFIKVLDEDSKPKIKVENSSDQEPIVYGDFHGAKRKKRSVQALINVLDELSDDKYHCAHCGLSFTTRTNMVKHCKAEHSDPDGNILCKYCDKAFSGIRALNTHVRSRHSQRKCQICDKVLSFNAYRNHVRAVHGDKSEKKFKCDLCDFTTHTKKYICDHKFREHSVKGSQLKAKKKFNECPDCSQVFPSKRSLNIHKETFHDSGLSQYDQFNCDDCNDVFTNPNHLLRHAQHTHQKIPFIFKNLAKYSCTQCNIVFMSEGLFKSHLSQYHPQNPRIDRVKGQGLNEVHACKQCDKTFKSPIHYSEHVKVVHEKSTPFHCELCTRKFGTRWVLKNHVAMVHTRETCNICGQLQYNSFYLKKHKASIHGIIPAGSYRCTQCTEWFKFKKNLDKHMETKHQS